MNYRLAKMLARKNYTVDDVEPIEVKIVDPISQIIVILERLGYGSTNEVGHPAKCIPELELIDGSDVLFSLSGVETQAVDFYHNKREAPNHRTDLVGNWDQQVLQMNFGRYLYDPVLAWDPKKFKSPQLKIKIDLDASCPNTASLYLTVLAHTFDEKMISPSGFLMHKEIKSWNLGDGAHEYTNMPTDYPYRKLFLRAQTYGSSPTAQVDGIKLSEDNDKRIPLDVTPKELLQAVMSQTPPYRETMTFPGFTATIPRFVVPTYSARYGSTCWRIDEHQSGLQLGFGDGGRLYVYTETTNRNMQIVGEGYLPHGVFEIPFGLQNEIDDWYDVTKLGSLKADITGGEDTGSAELMLQQLRTY